MTEIEDDDSSFTSTLISYSYVCSSSHGNIRSFPSLDCVTHNQLEASVNLPDEVN